MRGGSTALRVGWRQGSGFAAWRHSSHYRYANNRRHETFSRWLTRNRPALLIVVLAVFPDVPPLVRLRFYPHCNFFFFNLCDVTVDGGRLGDCRHLGWVRDQDRKSVVRERV